jgi:hypothetical protein
MDRLQLLLERSRTSTKAVLLPVLWDIDRKVLERGGYDQADGLGGTTLPPPPHQQQQQQQQWAQNLEELQKCAVVIEDVRVLLQPWVVPEGWGDVASEPACPPHLNLA